MSIDRSTTRLREQTRFTKTAQRADQIDVPGTDVQVTRTQAAIGAVALLLVLALLARGGGARRRGFEITDIGA